MIEKISDQVRSNQDTLFELFKELVNIPSPSGDKVGLTKVASIIGQRLQDLGFEGDIFPYDCKHNCIRFSKGKLDKCLLLIGHIDTVFGPDHSSFRGLSEDDIRFYGTGVSDMKDGSAAVIVALHALDQLALSPKRPITVIFNGDEEIGSVGSREIIEGTARSAAYALILESARQDGSLVVGRRGAVRYTLEVEGVAAHSGEDFTRGANSIVELAHHIIALHELSDPGKGSTVNIGKVSGGGKVNIVPDHAIAEIDVRMDSLAELERIITAIERQVSMKYISGTKVWLKGGKQRPPWEKGLPGTLRLYEMAKEIAQRLGFDISQNFSGGGSDGNFTAALGVATLDGLGPVGWNYHTASEYVEKGSFLPRTSLLAGLIYRLAYE